MHQVGTGAFSKSFTQNFQLDRNKLSLLRKNFSRPQQDQLLKQDSQKEKLGDQLSTSLQRKLGVKSIEKRDVADKAGKADKKLGEQLSSLKADLRSASDRIENNANDIDEKRAASLKGRVTVQKSSGSQSFLGRIANGIRKFAATKLEGRAEKLENTGQSRRAEIAKKIASGLRARISGQTDQVRVRPVDTKPAIDSDRQALNEITKKIDDAANLIERGEGKGDNKRLAKAVINKLNGILEDMGKASKGGRLGTLIGKAYEHVKKMRMGLEKSLKEAETKVEPPKGDTPPVDTGGGSGGTQGTGNGNGNGTGGSQGNGNGNGNGTGGSQGNGNGNGNGNGSAPPIDKPVKPIPKDIFSAPRLEDLSDDEIAKMNDDEFSRVLRADKMRESFREAQRADILAKLELSKARKSARPEMRIKKRAVEQKETGARLTISMNPTIKGNDSLNIGQQLQSINKALFDRKAGPAVNQTVVEQEAAMEEQKQGDKAARRAQRREDKQAEKAAKKVAKAAAKAERKAARQAARSERIDARETIIDGQGGVSEGEINVENATDGLKEARNRLKDAEKAIKDTLKGENLSQAVKDDLTQLKSDIQGLRRDLLDDLSSDSKDHAAKLSDGMKKLHDIQKGFVYSDSVKSGAFARELTPEQADKLGEALDSIAAAQSNSLDGYATGNSYLASKDEAIAQQSKELVFSEDQDLSRTFKEMKLFGDLVGRESVRSTIQQGEIGIVSIEWGSSGWGGGYGSSESSSKSFWG